MSARLSEPEILTALELVPEWHRENEEIVRTFTLGNFVEAVEFVNQVTEPAEDADHHPDIDIRWNLVALSVVSHSAGGVTKADLALAERISAVA